MDISSVVTIIFFSKYLRRTKIPNSVDIWETTLCVFTHVYLLDLPAFDSNGSGSILHATKSRFYGLLHSTELEGIKQVFAQASTKFLGVIIY